MTNKVFLAGATGAIGLALRGADEVDRGDE